MTELANWPDTFDPSQAPVFAHNEITTERSGEELWPALVKAAEWPLWYPHASDVEGVTPGEELVLGAIFRWKTLGVRVTTTVRELVPSRALAWSGVARGSRGYHRWELQPTPRGGCRIVTEEVQAGPVPTMLAGRLRKNLVTFHQEWLENLIAQ